MINRKIILWFVIPLGVAFFGLVFWLSIHKAPQSPATTDTIKPSIRITISPDKLQSVQGSLEVTVSASDNDRVTAVEYRLDGQVVATSSKPPFTVTLDISSLSPGEHTLQAMARDAAGNVSLSQTVTFAVESIVAGPPSGSPSGTSSGQSRAGGSRASGGSTASNQEQSNGGVPSSPSPILKGWNITAANIGLAPYGLSCDSLPVYTGTDKPAAGTVISQKRITMQLTLSEGNITIEKSCFQPTSVGPGTPIVNTTDLNTCGTGDCPPPSMVYIRDSEFDGSKLDEGQPDYTNSAHTSAFAGIGTLQRNYIHHVGSGITIWASGYQLDALVENNYVTSLTAWGDGASSGTHIDGFTLRAFDTSLNPNRMAVVRNNRINSAPISSPGASNNETSAFFIQTQAGNINNLLVEGNLLQGDNYQLVLAAGYGNSYGANMQAVDNRFSGNAGNFITYVADPPGWATWANNYMNDPGQVDNKGASVAQPTP